MNGSFTNKIPDQCNMDGDVVTNCIQRYGLQFLRSFCKMEIMCPGFDVENRSLVAVSSLMHFDYGLQGGSLLY
jgi:hypothetical protein